MVLPSISMVCTSIIVATVQKFKKKYFFSLITVLYALFWPNLSKYLAKMSLRLANWKNKVVLFYFEINFNTYLA